jgi:hypothetical protein
VNKIDTIKLVLTNAGWSESTRTERGDLTNGFQVYERNSRIHVDYVLGSRLERTRTLRELREMLEEQLTEIERELSRQGVPVMLFVPETGIRFFQLTAV